MGNLPGWYLVGMAARYWKVSPWELLARPDCHLWVGRAMTALNGEAEGNELARKADETRARAQAKK